MQYVTLPRRYLLTPFDGVKLTVCLNLWGLNPSHSQLSSTQTVSAKTGWWRLNALHILRSLLMMKLLDQLMHVNPYARNARYLQNVWDMHLPMTFRAYGEVLIELCEEE